MTDFSRLLVTRQQCSFRHPHPTPTQMHTHAFTYLDTLHYNPLPLHTHQCTSSVIQVVYACTCVWQCEGYSPVRQEPLAALLLEEDKAASRRNSFSQSFSFLSLSSVESASRRGGVVYLGLKEQSKGHFMP